MTREIEISGRFILGGAAALLFSGYLVAGITNIELHEAGIAVDMLGNDKGTTIELGTGLQWIEPFEYDVFTYNIRAEQYEMKTVSAETNDGQPIAADVSFEISLIPGSITSLHKNIGPNWYEQVVYPAAREAIRMNTAGVSSDEIYTQKGKSAVVAGIEKDLSILSDRGINVFANLRKVSFVNQDFVTNLEQKATAAQKEIIEKRLAAAAKETAIKMENLARGEKLERIQRAEANKEEKRLEGEGERLRLEEEAKGILAVKKAEAEGTRLQVKAYGEGSYYAQVQVAEALGDNFQVWGVPTGAPGTTSLIGIDKLVGKALGAAQVAE